MTSILLMLSMLVVAVLLAVENSAIVTLHVFSWQFDASLAVIIVLCFALGAIGALLAMMPRIYRSRNEERRLRARVAEIESPKAPERSGQPPKAGPPAAAPPFERAKSPPTIGSTRVPLSPHHPSNDL